MGRLAALFFIVVAGAGCDGAVPCSRASECGSGSVCIAGSCVTATPCTSSRACPSLVCDITAGSCVECTADVDCPVDLVCREQVCGTPPAACRSDRECSAMGLVCDETVGICVECAADGDCPTGGVCRDRACAAGCSSDRDCSAMALVCDFVGGTCVECVAPTDCDPASTCNAEHTCVPDPDRDAGAPGDAAPRADAGGLDAGVPAPDAGGADAGGTGPTHATLRLTWSISDTFGPLTCFDVGIAQVMATVTPSVGSPITRTFRCGDGAGDITGLDFGVVWVSTQGNNASGTFLVSGSITSLTLAASPCSSVVGGECVHETHTDFAF